MAKRWGRIKMFVLWTHKYKYLFFLLFSTNNDDLFSRLSLKNENIKKNWLSQAFCLPPRESVYQYFLPEFLLGYLMSNRIFFLKECFIIIFPLASKDKVYCCVAVIYINQDNNSFFQAKKKRFLSSYNFITLSLVFILS